MDPSTTLSSIFKLLFMFLVLISRATVLEGLGSLDSGSNINQFNPATPGSVVYPPNPAMAGSGAYPSNPTPAGSGAYPSNPVTGGSGVYPYSPVMAPTVVTVPIPSNTGGSGSWCVAVAVSGATEAALQAALDYACGIGGVDCSVIQPGANCFYPDTLQSHASVAFNAYYQRNPTPSSCDFGGTAIITNRNPSFGSCVFTTWSPSTVSPGMVSPITVNPQPPPVTEPLPSTGGYGAPPTILNITNPAMGNTINNGYGGSPILNITNPAMGNTINGFGDSPPISNSLPVSTSSIISQPFGGVILTLLAFAARIH